MGWFGHVVRRGKGSITRQAMDLMVDETKREGKTEVAGPNKCGFEETSAQGVDARDRVMWKSKTRIVDPKST